MQAEHRRLAERTFEAVFLVILISASAFYALGNYNHNDHMYAVAPVMAAHHRAYTDFAYVQTPLSLLLFMEIHRLAGDQSLYAALRGVSLLLNLSVLAIGLFLARRLAADKLLVTVLFAALYLCLGPTEGIGAEIGNYTLALFLFGLSLLCYDRLRAGSIAALLVGLLAGLAISAKISYVYVLPAYAALYLYDGWAAPHRVILRNLSLFGVGALLGLAPILYYLHADSKSFLFENVYIHYLTNIYRGISPFTGPSKLILFAIKSALIPFGLLAVALVIGWAILNRTGGSERFTDLKPTRRELEILVLAGAALIGAVTPSIIFPQYLAAPAFLLILFACIWLDRVLNKQGRKIIEPHARRVFLTAILLCCIWRSIGYVEDGVGRLRDGTYGVVAVANFRDRLSEKIAAIDANSPGCHGDLISAFAVPAVGAGATLSLVDSAGPFLMRLDGVFAARTPEFRRFSDVRRYLAPDSLVLSGFYNDASYEPSSPFEKIVDEYTASHRFRAISVGRFMNKAITLYMPVLCRA